MPTFPFKLFSGHNKLASPFFLLLLRHRHLKDSRKMRLNLRSISQGWNFSDFDHVREEEGVYMHN
jgi:hypothetical protein